MLPPVWACCSWTFCCLFKHVAAGHFATCLSMLQPNMLLCVWACCSQTGFRMFEHVEATLLQGLLKMKLSSGKLQFLEWKSPLLVLEHFAPCPYWYFTSFYAGNIFRSLKQDLLRGVTGKFRKILKLKMLGKTAGDLPHGEGKSRT